MNERWAFWNHVIKGSMERNNAVPKEAKVKDVWSSSKRGGSWTPLFSRYFNDWELDDMETYVLFMQEESKYG